MCAHTQSTLQLYCDCPRRYWLSVVRRLPWPAARTASSQEDERRARLGTHFHRMVQRALRDLPVAAGAVRGEAGRWFAEWRAAWDEAQSGLPLLREIECTLSTPLPLGDGRGSVRLLARYDLLAVEPGRRAVIIDWKSSGSLPPLDRLYARVQSRLYPFILVEAGPALPWGPLLPEQVEMRYWFAAAPREPVILRYNDEQHAAQRQWLRTLLDDILSRQSEEEFPPAPGDTTTRHALCAHCIYRSRCGRDGIPISLPTSCIWELPQPAPWEIDPVYTYPVYTYSR